ncbi:SGNH/GDSL hydrolase family protein [Litoribrevibacter albus]|uniref:SGNH/GDSL hydrolase family protein n=1 Tax=Litoribrevibacter albus TaxID=1473156 RepID=A0AA37W9H3_9GAMM|nr:SGNH/GDSL hydrolase family protein [Litoribrevibacter albus]GLQ32651.1 hypothetical protein GCM10007876_31300 [Litoribrevibacter albus]
MSTTHSHKAVTVKKALIHKALSHKVLTSNALARTAMAVLVTSLAVFSQFSQAETPSKAAVVGDSITMGFAADCTGNVWFWDLFCLLGGDQPEHSWFDGSSSNVQSFDDKWDSISSGVNSTKAAAKSGSEMRGGDNNFAYQAQQIVAMTTKPDHVSVELGGNDICNRGCVDPNNCDDPLYTDAEWREAVRNGLNVLVDGLPAGSSVHLGSVPRVQDLRAAGLEKQSSSGSINCESLWSSFSVCEVATAGGTFNGESHATRYAGVSVAQQRYNEILREEAEAYNANNAGQNPRGIEVVADYVDENTLSAGTRSFGASEIDGGDCFHPSIKGQNLVSDILWMSNPSK